MKTCGLHKESGVGRGTWRRPRAASAAMLWAFALILAAPVAGWAQEAGDTEALRRQVLEGLKKGKDVSAALERLRSLSPPAAGLRPPKSDLAREISGLLRESSEILERVVASGEPGGKTEGLLSSLAAKAASLQADLLLLEEQAVRTESALKAVGAPSEFHERNAAAREGTVGLLKEYLALVAGIEKAPPAEALDRAKRALSLLKDRLRPPSRPILGAGLLPYRSLSIPPRAPLLSPVLEPAYRVKGAVPNPADLDPTVDAPWPAEIVQKAGDLKYDPIKIYEFVRNEIQQEWYFGSMKGAAETLRQRAGNDADQASLLIALLRASGFPSRYVRGAIEVPLDRAARWMGLMDGAGATDLLSRAGVPHAPVIRGGRIDAVRIEHVWAETYVPYSNYRGAILDEHGKIWAPLDPSYKVYDVKAGLGLPPEIGFDAAAWLEEYLSTVRPESPFAYVKRRIVEALREVRPGTEYDQLLSARTLVPEVLGLLPNTLPTQVVAVTAEYASLPDDLRHRVRITAKDPEGEILSAIFPLSDVAGQRVTLSYMPATVEDDRIANSFGGLDGVPPYLIRVRPVVKVNGAPRAVGLRGIEAGREHDLEIEIVAPWGSEVAADRAIAGGYNAIAVAAQGVAPPADAPPDPADTEAETDAAEIMSRRAYRFVERWDAAEEEIARLLGARIVRPLPAVAVVGGAVNVDYVLDRPYSFEWKGLFLDADIRSASPVPLSAGADPSASLLRLSAAEGSSLEHRVFEDDLLVPSISTAKGLALARDHALPVVDVTSANVDAVLPALAAPESVKQAVRDAVGQGLVVRIADGEIAYEDWRGAAFRVEDPVTGAAGYMLSGGIAGGATAVDPPRWILDFIAQALGYPYSPRPNTDPSSGVSIVMLSDYQEGIVGQALSSRVGVMIRDERGRRVQGAPVTFQAISGGGTITETVVPTNFMGIAGTKLTLGTRTADSPLFVLRNPGDKYLTQVGVNQVSAGASGKWGPLAPERPFTAIAHPDAPSALIKQLGDGNKAVVNMNAGSISVGVQDQYGNPISNVGVLFQVQEPAESLNPNAPLPSGYRNLTLFNRERCPDNWFDVAPGECGSANAASDISMTDGSAHVETIIGNTLETQYRVTASAGGLSPVQFVLRSEGHRINAESYLQPVVMIGGIGLVTGRGNSTDAARVGNQVVRPFSVRITLLMDSLGAKANSSEKCGTFYTPISKDGGLVRSMPVEGAEVSFTATEGGGVAGPTEGEGNGIYSSRLTVGPSPGLNRVKATGKATVSVEYLDVISGNILNKSLTLETGEHHAAWTVKTGEDGCPKKSDVVPCDKCFGADPAPCVEFQVCALGVYILFPAYGVLPTITGVAPAPLQANAESFLATNGLFSYKIEPSDYDALGAAIDVTEGGGWLGYLVGNATKGSGQATLHQGTPVDVNKPHGAQLVLGRGSQVEIRSDPFPFVVDQKILIGVSRWVETAKIEGECPFSMGSELQYTLTQDASVSVELRGLTGAPSVTLLSSVSQGRGRHSIPLDPSVIREGRYECKITATGSVSGRTETELATVVSIRRARHTGMRVGHVLVKNVDLADGHLFLSTEDLSYPGRGPVLSFRRSYSSNAGGAVGPLGVGWTHNYISRIHSTGCGDIIVIGGEGSGTRFRPTLDGKFVPQKGSHGTLQANADYSFDYFSKDGTRYRYEVIGSDRHWSLTSITDPNGNGTTLVYKPGTFGSSVVQVKNSAGRTLDFSYTQKTGLDRPVLTRVEGTDGVSLTFEYDADGYLLSVSREGGARKESYTYTRAVGDAYSLLASAADPNGNQTRYTYERLGSPLAQMVARIAEPEGATTSISYVFGPLGVSQATVTNPLGNGTAYALNDDGNPTEIRDPAGTTSMTWAPDDTLMTSRTDANGVTTSFEYDADGNVTRESVAGAETSYTYASLSGFSVPIKNRVRAKTDRNGRTTTFDYDSRGNLTAVTNPAGGTTRHSYAGNGDRLSTTDPNGGSTRFSHDSYGNVTGITDPAGGRTSSDYDPRGRLIRTTDAEGRTTSFTRDALGRVIGRTGPAGSRSYEYDAKGNKLSETDEEERTTRFTYDGLDRLTVVVDPARGRRSFGYDEAGNKTSETDPGDHTTSFSYDAANRLVRRSGPLGNSTEYSYDAMGNKTRETDGNGHATAFSYDAMNRLVSVADPLGRTTRFSYDGVGNKTSETDRSGGTTTFAYDGADRLTRRTSPLENTVTYAYDGNGNKIRETDPRGGVTTFSYDAANRLVRRTDPAGGSTFFSYDKVGNKLRETDPRGNSTTYSYDSQNRVASVRDASGAVTRFEYDRVGNRTSQTDALGRTTRYSYDALNRLVSVVDPLGREISYDYDADGNRTRETDRRGNATTRDYDANHRPVRIVRPEGGTTTYAYDPAGYKTSETDPRGNTTSFSYDASNRLTTVTDPFGGRVQYSYDGNGNKIRETDKRGNATTFSYDSDNRLTDVVDPLGGSLSYGYDASGNRVSETDKRGTVTTHVYDPANRLVRTEKAGVTVFRATYDAAGNRATQTDANGNATVHDYDSRNLLVKETRPLLAVRTIEYDAMRNRVRETDPEGHATFFQYDALNRLLKRIDPLGNQTLHEYDADGNLVKTTQPEGNAALFAYDRQNRLVSVTDALGGATAHTYDTAGNRISQTDPNGNVTAYEYDALNRLARTVQPGGRVTAYGYDADGSRTSLTDPKGQVFSFHYDAIGRRVREDSPASGGDDLLRIDRSYDENGNETRVVETYTGPTGTRTAARVYDAFDRLVSVTDPEGKRVLYGYDANGSRTSVTDPDGKVTTYAYDALNRLATVGAAGGFTTYVYDRDGRTVSAAHPNGTTAAYTYDAAHRITAIANKKGGSPVSTYAYVYDRNGNRTRQEETNGGGLEVTTYAFDPNDRLKEIVYPDKTVAYTHDAAGNRLTEKATSGATLLLDRTYSYSPGNQLTQITDNIDASKSASLSYDANGNRISKTAAGTTTEFVYDAGNRLASVKQGTSTLALFAYDAEGRRREKVGLDGLIRYVYDGQRVLLETTNLGETVTKYDWGADRPISLTHATQGRQYFHFDALGSTANLTTAAGYIQATYQLDAWGSVRKTLGTSVNTRLFTGKERDVETGLYYFGARYYDPEAGRFLTEDPYWGGSATPPSLHRYLYAYGNPVRYVDLYGYLTWDDVTDTAALFAGGVAGSAVSIVFGATEVAGLGLDIMGTELYYQSSGLLGRESYERTTALTEGLARALANPVGTARAIGEHYGKEADLAAQEYAEGRSFTAGVVAGKNLFDLYMLVRALPEVARVAGVAKTGSALAAEGEAAATSARQAVRDAAKIAEEGSQGPALVPVEPPAILRARVLNAVEESAAARALGEAGVAAKGLPDAYAWIRQASQHLQEMGVSRADRVRYLQSFEPQNMVVRQAGQSEFGLRYFSDPNRAGGQYLFETFPASRSSLAIKPEWSTMSGFRQFQIRPGATILEGRAAAQGPYLPGGQVQKFILDWRSDLIAP